MSTRTSPPDDAAGLVAAAQRWLDDDPDAATRAELSTVLASGDGTGIADRFGSHLTFGTAGLRGELGAGPNRMNRVVVQRAAAGLAAYLGTAGSGRVVIGYDARHNSEVFARDTADVVQGAGHTALVLPRPLPTPVLAYAIRALGCVAGVMVTASHNPPRDNGYKVYLGDGSQIVPPADADIAAEIANVGRVRDLPRDEGWTGVDESLVDRYVERAASLVDPASPRDLRVVYTPMHGVGRETFERAFAAAGFSAPVVVAEQADPDPDFPTVSFPNPEEPGALDLTKAKAAEVGADLAIANDPDADRCAVVVPDGRDGFATLRGDEVGALLAAHILRRGGRPEGVFAASIVSGTLLHRIADAAGVPYVETLTGFKWLSRVPNLRYAYEEALGYCVDPAAVADKDGITAALLVAELAASLEADGRGLTDLLDELAVEHGLHATDQLSVRLTRVEDGDAVLARLLAHPPTSVGGLAVESVESLAGDHTGLPPTPGARLRLAERGRVVVRPSGTEPKLKCYLEVVVPVEDADVGAARVRADGRLAALRAELAGLVRV
ncbi:MAG: phospho-sugar mutase [Acidothermales bacterium]|nr:phospho-sugar mutase [Acidothermales bacterium]